MRQIDPWRWRARESKSDMRDAATPKHVECARHGVILSPDGSAAEAEGILNPGVTRGRNGELLLYPRKVAEGNVSCIGLVRCHDESGEMRFARLGNALEPEMEYEIRAVPGGFGCEDARVTFVPSLDVYLMAYTGFGLRGPRIAIAVSDDGYRWTKIGLVHFPVDALNALDNKDGAFFPEPVYSPKNVLSFAMYHRPMLPFSVNGQAPISVIRSLDKKFRESAALAYVPVDAVRNDLHALRFPAETLKVLPVDDSWGSLKNGAGTPPVRVDAGWLSIFHAVDVNGLDENPTRVYSAGIVIHDATHPHRIRYRSPEALIRPTTLDERVGVVNNVVFPTGLDPLGDDRYSIYYGAADSKISRAELRLSF